MHDLFYSLICSQNNVREVQLLPAAPLGQPKILGKKAVGSPEDKKRCGEQGQAEQQKMSSIQGR